MPEEDGKVGYKLQGEDTYSKSYANKTVFAYLHFAEEGRIPEDSAEEHVGIDVVCGRFSFADIPNQYSCILGVTGTLRELFTVHGIKRPLGLVSLFLKLGFLLGGLIRVPAK